LQRYADSWRSEGGVGGVGVFMGVVMEALVLIAAMAAPQEAFFTMTQICWDATKGYELRADFKWAIHSPTPVKVIQVKTAAKAKATQNAMSGNVCISPQKTKIN